MNYFSIEPIGKQRYNDMVTEGLRSQEVNRLSPHHRFSLRWKYAFLIAGFAIALMHFLPA